MRHWHFAILAVLTLGGCALPGSTVTTSFLSTMHPSQEFCASRGLALDSATKQCMAVTAPHPASGDSVTGSLPQASQGPPQPSSTPPRRLLRLPPPRRQRRPRRPTHLRPLHRLHPCRRRPRPRHLRHCCKGRGRAVNRRTLQCQSKPMPRLTPDSRWTASRCPNSLTSSAPAATGATASARFGLFRPLADTNLPAIARTTGMQSRTTAAALLSPWNRATSAQVEPVFRKTMLHQISKWRWTRSLRPVQHLRLSSDGDVGRHNPWQ